MPEAITVAEIAKRLGVSREHVYNMTRRGLPSRKVGRRVVIMRDEFDAWWAEQVR